MDRRVLPSLVRMTAVNASRAKRSLILGMQTLYPLPYNVFSVTWLKQRHWIAT